ncbi:MAG: hypothetical protein CVU60_11080 [Deltaproteobacteria bacterium HGW-Deltaproteobacteria-18]|jgi:prophage antirepressor-like protein|nr:MAG: hypothetical protein CVU60_11080 [Deltaproteobacteria bacterium HGW-Deltaproteobacteria-18]
MSNTTTNAITTFQFPLTIGRDVNVRITDQNGDPWFIAKDVCEILGFRDAYNGVRLLDDDEKGTLNVSTPGGDQDLTIINESGLYSLILRSRKAEAKRFKKWVTNDVLPSIRKNGGYIIGQEKIVTGEMSDLEFLAKAQTVAGRVLMALTRERDALLAANAAMLPKAKRYDAVVADKDQMVHEFARKLKGVLNFEQTSYIHPQNGQSQAFLPYVRGGP